MNKTFPFSAIVGQDEMSLALILVAIDSSIGGVLVLGDRGTGKSTAVRALANILPLLKSVKGCSYQCDPKWIAGLCESCTSQYNSIPRSRKKLLKAESIPVPVVDLPLGVTEDRVVGSLDLQSALTEGLKKFDPGLLADANRGFLYIDEVNLLEDHIVDLLIDVAASKENIVEREGLSLSHPANFVLVGSGNPEEGELRPQLLDRFGFSVEVKTPVDLDERIEVIRRRNAFDSDPNTFMAAWHQEDQIIRKKIESARRRLPKVIIPDEILRTMAELCIFLKTDGLRGELTLTRASCALASLERSSKVKISHIKKIAKMCLRHRLRKNPLDDTSSTVRVEKGVSEILGE
ncbi:MAG: magnesium chelatase ATPase subunit I [Betaproteobacteria bacterium TMED156]|nr:MAG: magnesium chelatase ATPase subunit I [Betaproteobacteria bacterium TMED156]